MTFGTGRLKLALARYRDGDADGAIAALQDTLRLDEGWPTPSI